MNSLHIPQYLYEIADIIILIFDTLTSDQTNSSRTIFAHSLQPPKRNKYYIENLPNWNHAYLYSYTLHKSLSLNVYFLCHRSVRIPNETLLLQK